MGMISISKERDQKLRKLARRMNGQGFNRLPVIRLLVEVFDAAMTPEETDFLLEIGTSFRSREELHQISCLPENEFNSFLDTLLKKGLIWVYGNDREERYILPGIIVGWFEMYLSNGQETEEKREFARRLERMFRTMKYLNISPVRQIVDHKVRNKTKPLSRILVGEFKGNSRIIEVGVHVRMKTPLPKVYPSRTVMEILEKFGKKNQLAVVHCFCRQWKKMVENPCRFSHPGESCLAVGPITDHVVLHDIGRRITVEEAKSIIDELCRRGAVHQVFHEKDDIDREEFGICSCCWDCCGILGSYNRGLMPLSFRTFTLAKVADEEACCGCGRCVEYCPVEAAQLVSGTVRVDSSRCIGCGQCERQCSQEVIKLVSLEREVFLPMRKRSQARLSPSGDDSRNPASSFSNE